MTNQPMAPRYHALDGVRAFSMVLGVLLHASIPYIHVPFPWAVVDNSRSVALTLAVFVIHTFRMPAFFLIAGFFARLLVHRLGTGAFVRHRAKRVLLPLVVGWIVLYPMILFLWAWGHAPQQAIANPGGISEEPHGLPFLGYGHLWFLYYLLLLSGLALAGRWLFFRPSEASDQRRQRLDALFRSVVGSRFGLLGFALPTTCGLVLMRGWGVDFVDNSLIPRVAHMVFYGTFFLAGWMLHRQPSLLDTIRARWIMHLGIACVLLVPTLFFLFFVYVVHVEFGLGFRMVYFLVYAIIAWGFVLAILGVFQRFLVQPNRVWRYLADASYWLYLAHLPVVIAMSILLRDWAVIWLVKLLVVLVTSAAMLLGSYHVLVRNTWVGVVLNGRRMSCRSTSC